MTFLCESPLKYVHTIISKYGVIGNLIICNLFTSFMLTATVLDIKACSDHQSHSLCLKAKQQTRLHDPTESQVEAPESAGSTNKKHTNT